MNRPPVYLVGAGPGAADLLTLRAARLLSQADIVFYDALVQPEVIALAEKAVKISVGKRCGKHSSAQRFIHKRLIDAAHAGQTVVRLKGGDPMLFGRAQEEIDALSKAGIDVEVVPGVSAAFATSARLGISLTRRGLARSVCFVTPRVGLHESQSNDWIRAAMAADTCAMYMGAEAVHTVVTALLEAGRSPHTACALIENASCPNERVWFSALIALPALVDRVELTGPAIIMMGEVYAHAQTKNVQQPYTQVEYVAPYATLQRQWSA